MSGGVVSGGAVQVVALRLMLIIQEAEKRRLMVVVKVRRDEGKVQKERRMVVWCHQGEGDGYGGRAARPVALDLLCRCANAGYYGAAERA